MHHRRLLALAAPFAMFAVTVVAACEDDTGSNSGVQLPEAGLPENNVPPFDGSVPDTFVPEDQFVPPKPVTVTVTSRKGPVADVDVVFHDASGAVVATKKTDATGKASSDPYPAATPSMATVAFAGASLDVRHFLTYSALAAGDDLQVVAPEDNSLNIPFDLHAPSQVDAGGAQVYYQFAVGDCGSTDISTTRFINVYSNCYRGIDSVLVTALDSSNNFNALAYSRKKGTNAAVDGATNDFTTDAFVAATTLTINVSNPPNAFGNIHLQTVIGTTPFVAYHQLADQTQIVVPAAPASVADAYNIGAVFPTTDPSSTRTIGTRMAPAATVTFDGNTLPEAITDATLDTTTAPASRHRPKTTWTGSVAALKGGVVRLRFDDNSTEKTTFWTFVLPASATAASAPQLPATFDAYLPDPDASDNWGVPEVSFFDASILADYGTFKKIAGVVLPSADNNSISMEDLVLPQAGTFKVARYRYTPQ